MTFYGLLAIVLVVNLLGSVGHAGEDDEPLPLVTGYNYSPFTDDDLPGGGLATQLVRAIFDGLDQPVDIEFLSWTPGYQATLKGTYAGTFPYIRAPDREAKFLYSQPLFEVGSYLYVQRDTQIVADDPTDLVGLTLCLPSGYAPGPIIGQMIDDGRIQRVTPADMPTCFQQLLAGEVHFVKINRYVARDILRNAGVEVSEVRALPFKVEDLTMHFIVSRTYPDANALIARFNRSLQELKDSGGFELLIDIYFKQQYGDKH